MIGRITTETACAVTRTPYERTQQYLKRGQLVLEMDRTTPRPKTREWLVMDVVRLAVLRELTDLGVSIGRAAELLTDRSAIASTAWEQLGCDARIVEPGAPEWYLVATRDHMSTEPAITLANSRHVAAMEIWPATGERPRSAVIVDMTSIARDVRNKLEAIGTA